MPDSGLSGDVSEDCIVVVVVIGCSASICQDLRKVWKTHYWLFICFAASRRFCGRAEPYSIDDCFTTPYQHSIKHAKISDLCASMHSFIKVRRHQVLVGLFHSYCVAYRRPQSLKEVSLHYNRNWGIASSTTPE